MKGSSGHLSICTWRARISTVDGSALVLVHAIQSVLQCTVQVMVLQGTCSCRQTYWFYIRSVALQVSVLPYHIRSCQWQSAIQKRVQPSLGYHSCNQRSISMVLLCFMEGTQRISPVGTLHSGHDARLLCTHLRHIGPVLKTLVLMLGAFNYS